MCGEKIGFLLLGGIHHPFSVSTTRNHSHIPYISFNILEKGGSPYKLKKWLCVCVMQSYHQESSFLPW